jgi:hypothetical protein
MAWCDSFSQSESTGFYVILDRKRECKNPFKSMNEGLPLCLSKAPIIAQGDFESISQVFIDSVKQAKYINLKISKGAYDKFLLISKKLPRIDLALVVDGTIVGVLDNLDAIGNPIPIYANLYSSDVEWVYQKLKKVKMGQKL